MTCDSLSHATRTIPSLSHDARPIQLQRLVENGCTLPSDALTIRRRADHFVSALALFAQAMKRPSGDHVGPARENPSAIARTASFRWLPPPASATTSAV